jgi:16S rRNA processing protein RimM
MTIDSCFKLGKISKAHGLKGEVLIILEKEFPVQYSSLGSVFVDINKKLIPFFIQNISVSQKKAFVKFEDINDLNEVSALVGKDVYLPESLLPEGEEGVILYTDLIGYTISDKTLGVLGKIVDLYETPAQDIFAMEYKEKEILIPAKEELILKVEKKKKILHMDIPEGLVDLYME